jgi:lysozyme
MIPSQKFLDQLKRHEGLRLKPYRCTAGKLTIGYGRNLDDVGISVEEAERLLANDVDMTYNTCIHAFPWFAELSEDRQSVIMNMCFNLGLTKLKGFKNFLKAMEMGAYATAAHEMSDSDWFEQVGSRAVELRSMVLGPENI